jgi:hypothetical protein
LEKISKFIEYPRIVTEFGEKLHGEYEWPYLEQIEVLAQLLKLICNRKNERRLTRLGREYLALPTQKQYWELFIAYWQYLNWVYLFPSAVEDKDNPAWHLREAEDFVVREVQKYPKDVEGWISFQDFAEYLRIELNLKLINYLGEDLPKRVHDCIKNVLLEPLHEFGIFDFKYEKKKIFKYEFDDMVAFKITQLGEIVINFIIQPEEPMLFDFLGKEFNLN